MRQSRLILPSSTTWACRAWQSSVQSSGALNDFWRHAKLTLDEKLLTPGSKHMPSMQVMPWHTCDFQGEQLSSVTGWLSSCSMLLAIVSVVAYLCDM
jgi:hypothetical protein